MGNEASLQMEMATNFDAEEIKRLGKRFKKLDLDNSGSLSVDEFMTLPELQQNPLVQRVIDIFDEDGNGEVDFKEFIQGVSQFSVKGDKSSKLKFAFRYVIFFVFMKDLKMNPNAISESTILITTGTSATVSSSRC